MTTEIDKVLAAFPGPVTLHPSKLKMLSLCFGIGLVNVIPIYAFFFSHDPLPWRIVLICILLAAVSIPLPLWLAFSVLSGRYKIVLDPEGFDFRTGLVRRRRRWAEVRDFAPSYSRYGTYIHFSDVTPDTVTKSILKFFKGSNFITEKFGFSAGDFCGLLNKWRERALAR